MLNSLQLNDIVRALQEFEQGGIIPNELPPIPLLSTSIVCIFEGRVFIILLDII